MPVEIIRELTKTKEGSDVTNEQVLAWAKRVEPQKAQTITITCPGETKNFDKIKTAKEGQRQYEKNHKRCQNANEPELQVLWFKPST